MKKILYLILFLLIYSPKIFAQHEKRSKPKPDSTARVRQLNEVRIDGQKATKLKKDTLSNGLRMQVPLLQMPQNIISISAALIQQQGALQLKDMARNASGVYFGYNSSPFDNSASIKVRGFNASTTINGMPSRLVLGATLDDEALIENLEFIKGPAGFISALGEPGGTLNIVTKSPKEKLLNAQITGGNYNLFRATADIGSSLKSKGFSYRFNTAFQNQNSYLNYMKTTKYVIAPVLQYNFSPKTYLIAEYNYIRGEVKNGSSINKLRQDKDVLQDPISLNYSAGIGLPLSVSQTHTFRFSGVHKFNENWQLTSQSNFVRAPAHQWYMVSANNRTSISFNDQGKTNRIASNSNLFGETYNTNLFLSGKFKTGALKHNLLIGSDYTTGKDSLATYYGSNPTPFDRNRPDFYVDPNVVTITKRSIRQENKIHYSAAYVYDNITLDKFLLTLGARYTDYRNRNILTTTRGPRTPEYYRQNAFSPRAALTFMPDSTSSVYFLFDQSFVPKTGQVVTETIDGPQAGQKTVTASKAVAPELGNNFELGFKKNWFKGRLLTTINGFHSVKRNVAARDFGSYAAAVGGVIYYLQLGEVVSNGFEVDVIGNITDRFSLITNYTYVDAKITKDNNLNPTADNPSIVGQKMPDIPQQVFNTWLQYSIPLKGYHKISISAGQSTITRLSAISQKDTYLPNYTKFDAGLSFSNPKYMFRLIADNLTNKRYMASGDITTDFPYTGNNYFFVEGEPFTIRLSLGVKF
ncbi:TonB-dependent receptor [Pedobacter sp. HDW13]|uniref:TonB-dependent siderophore receptor n=1 Tax=Pedobacter sp. HDW13 TaxID=2714940 RepID=UPI001408EEEC|nr:TonB-dependent receptor [Pedobacter sp. HDW13]QIL41389.1 TonB-dependent receptor [Pedobacter sp. HDW13]